MIGKSRSGDDSVNGFFVLIINVLQVLSNH